MVAGVILLLLVVCVVIFILLGGTSRFFGSVNATPTRTPTPQAQPITILPVLATPVPTTPVPTPVTTKYKVKPGDSLIEIAARFKVSVQAIKTANGMKDDTIRIGDELIIPLPTPTPPPGSRPSSPGGTPTPVSLDSPPNSASPAASPGVIVYTVQRGDTLITIAATYGSTVDAIRVASQLDSDFLSIGQVLNVPVGSWTPTPTATSLTQTTPTPTLQFAYAAPSLLSPSDNQTFRGSKDAPTLAWTAPATLKPGEFYVLHISTGAGATKKSWSLQIKQGTSKTLDLSHYPGANPNGTRFSWYVVIVNQINSRAPAATSAPVSASSSPSETRTFVWY